MNGADTPEIEVLEVGDRQKWRGQSVWDGERLSVVTAVEDSTSNSL